MPTRTLGVKYSTEGVQEAIRGIRSTGQEFDRALENARRSLEESLDAQRQAIRRGITPEIERAEKQRANAARAANRVIQNNFKENNEQVKKAGKGFRRSSKI